jgi:hypothetical protein
MNIWRLLIVVLSIVVLLSSMLAPPHGHVLFAVLLPACVFITFLREASRAVISDDTAPAFLARALLTSRAPPVP